MLTHVVSSTGAIVLFMIAQVHVVEGDQGFLDGGGGVRHPTNVRILLQ